MKKKYNVVIIGGGFSGLVAADILSNRGLSILFVDENNYLGGQLLRKIPERLGKYLKYKPDSIKKYGYNLAKKVFDSDIEIALNSRVIGIYKDKELLVEVEEKKVFNVKAEVILFATGARERFLPFKGWTLPGVYSTGMAQIMMKSSGVLPGRNVLISGSGMFLFAVGYELIKNGAKLHGIYENSGFVDKVKLISQFIPQFSKFAEGGRYLFKIYSSLVPIRYRRRVIEARGDKGVEEVVVAKLNKEGYPISGSEKVYKVDSLLTGFGFVANIELPQLAGCETEFDKKKGGWIIKVKDNLETSISDIYAAGEITGIAGSLKSINEGKIAANSILKRFKLIENNDYENNLKKLINERKKHLKFGEYFNTLYSIGKGDILSIDDNTVICRCEDVKLKDIKESVKNGYTTPGGLKISVRAGMGNCQARTCGPVIYDIINVLTNKGYKDIGTFSVRPPIKPICMNSLKNFED